LGNLLLERQILSQDQMTFLSWSSEGPEDKEGLQKSRLSLGGVSVSHLSYSDGSVRSSRTPLGHRPACNTSILRKSRGGGGGPQAPGSGEDSENFAPRGESYDSGGGFRTAVLKKYLVEKEEMEGKEK